MRKWAAVNSKAPPGKNVLFHQNFLTGMVENKNSTTIGLLDLATEALVRKAGTLKQQTGCQIVSLHFKNHFVFV